MTRRNDHHDGHDEALARAVARSLFEDATLDWNQAFAAARRVLGHSVRDAMPSQARVRRHLEALEEVRLGAEGACLARRARVVRIVEVLEFVHFILEPAEILVVGLLAQGVVVGPLEVHGRVLEGRSFQGLFDQLESVGIKEVSSSSIAGPLGRFESVRFESDGEDFTLTRISQAQHETTNERNLVTGKPITQVTLETFSQLFASP